MVLGFALASASAFADAAPAVDRVALRNELAAQRQINLKRFRDYRVKRIYPHNTYQNGPLNVWTDADGHLCAVATLMDKAGMHDLVETTAHDKNFVRVADLASGPLIDWVLTSGFTQEEIVMIQQPTQAYIDEMNWEDRVARRKLKRQRAREDNRLEANYVAIHRMLEARVMSDASLDLAVARLAARPELAAQLHAR